MISYFIIPITSKKFTGMFTHYHRLEKTKFVFTRRTGVRVGDFDIQIQPDK